MKYTHTLYHEVPHNAVIQLNVTEFWIPFHTKEWDRLGWRWLVEPLRDENRWCHRCKVGEAHAIHLCDECMFGVMRGE